MVLKRSRKAYLANRLKGTPLALVVGLAVFVGSRAGLIGAVLGLVTAAAALVAVHRALAGVRVEIDDDGIVHRGALRTRRWAWADVGSVLHASGVTTTAIQPEVTWVVPRGRRGRRLFQITSMTWPPEALVTLVARAAEHAQVLREPGPLTLREVARRHRGAFSMAQRRPMVSSILATVLVVVVIVAGSYLGYLWFGPEDN